MDFTKKESQIVILRIFCQLFPSPPSLYAPHKAFSVHQECMQTQTGTVTQQREDDVEISHHTLLFTCHPAGPAAKTDLSSWHNLNFTNSPSTQKTSAAEWFWANRWGELTISAKTHTAGPCTLASAEARSHRHTATWYTDVYMHEHAVYSPTLAWMHYVDAVPMRRMTTRQISHGGFEAESPLSCCVCCHHGGPPGNLVCANNAIKLRSQNRLSY